MKSRDLVTSLFDVTPLMDSLLLYSKVHSTWGWNSRWRRTGITTAPQSWTFKSRVFFCVFQMGGIPNRCFLRFVLLMKREINGRNCLEMRSADEVLRLPHSGAHFVHPSDEVLMPANILGWRFAPVSRKHDHDSSLGSSSITDGQMPELFQGKKKNKNKPNTVLELRLINANGSKDHFEVKQPTTIINSFLYWFYVFIFRKSFQSKLSFGSKEIVAISCSWCKAAYHNKENCFNIDRLKEPCSLGEFSFCS